MLPGPATALHTWWDFIRDHPEGWTMLVRKRLFLDCCFDSRHVHMCEVSADPVCVQCERRLVFRTNVRYTCIAV